MAPQPSKASGGKQASPELLRRLPSIDRVLELPKLREWARISGYGREFVGRAAAAHLDAIRDAVLAETLDEEGFDAALEDLVGGVAAVADALAAPHLRPVINATGVVVHTNLGRAPWPAAVAERAAALSRRYLNLEFDLEGGGRGQRAAALERMVGELLGGAAVAVVNNNAAAVLLVLNTLAPAKEVVVSRGQLVEIGGSFRIPDVMSKSQSVLREVGTTNRTRIGDFQAALGPDTGVLLSVHPSNYRVVGFTEEVELADLVALGRGAGVPVVEDLGSGCFIDLKALGIDHEPTVAERLATGVDLLTFSGDKLLGGPQAGFIIGDPELVARVRANPLYRALRIDKATTLALEATLAAYVTGDLESIPTVAMLRATPAALEARARGLAATIEAGLAEAAAPRQQAGATVQVIAVESRVGGGAAPGGELPSFALAIAAAAKPDELARRMRTGDPPVIARIVDDRVVCDVRTILPDEDDDFVATVGRALKIDS